jgi:hypothetical protein
LASGNSGIKKVYIGPLPPQSFALENGINETAELETAADDFRAPSPPTASREFSQGTPSPVSSGTMSLLRRSSLSSTARRTASDNSIFSSPAIQLQIHQIVADAIAEVRDQLLQPNPSPNTQVRRNITPSTPSHSRNRQTVPLRPRNLREEPLDRQLDNRSTLIRTLDLDMESSDNESLPSIGAALLSEFSSTRVQHVTSSSSATAEFDLAQAGSLTLNRR